MPLTLHFLRHGQTALSRENVFCGSGMDPDLTEDGLQMANAFAAAYQGTGWAAVYASPLKRTVQTAAPITAPARIQPELREGLREVGYGRWEGLSVEQVDAEFHDDYVRWTADPAWNAPTEGETAVTVARRALEVIDEIRQRFPEGHVLVVSHKATIRVVLCGLLGIDVGRFRFRLGCPVASVSVVEFARQGPLLKYLADVRHLDERLRNLPGT